jgi:SMODS and SLOG-associating 2TM effector domain 1
VSQRTVEFQTFYQKCRIGDQLDFYTRRRTLFDRAANQTLALSAILLGFTTAVAALTGTNVGPVWLWSILATVLPATSTALTSYSSLYAFEQQSKIYGDAVRAVHAAARPVADPDPATPRPPEQDAADLVRRVETVFRQEQAQWGQLTAQIQIPDETKA